MNAINPSTLVVTPFARRNLHLVRDLLARNYYTHSHLDWHESDHWLETERAPIRLAWLHGALVGMMAASEPLNGASWIRLAGVPDQLDPGPIFMALWAEIRQALTEQGASLAAMLLVRDWPLPMLRDIGFTFNEEVVTLRRSDRTPPPDGTPAWLRLRAARHDDVTAMTQVDQAAFSPPWQMPLSDLRQAQKVSAYGTVALAQLDGAERIVGYQISTLYFDGSHLARLAVEPAMQGRGVGSALTRDVLRYFARRGVYAMTVNTQGTNIVSQNLYQKLGFRHNGYDLPVWTLPL